MSEPIIMTSSSSGSCCVASSPPESATKNTSKEGRRLLSDFEQVVPVTKLKALTIETSESNIDCGTPEPKKVGISPTCVAEVGVQAPHEHQPLVLAVQDPKAVEEDAILPDFNLHPSLAIDLSQACINRISFYGGVIHDINKEASDMASHDTSAFEPIRAAVIDEEQWLINTISGRRDLSVKDIQPRALAEAIGELDNLKASRTQLWKPSRSWWEARSGKNPWIEPRSHNKRWRYLWPIIHYHKFLARCIKKLKRCGVEVARSHAPVCIFLRTEVCAISMHLAEVSKFTAEQWLEALQEFHGWTDHEHNAALRMAVSQQKLRSLQDHGDIASPLLRHQIDEQFLRAMENQKANLQGANKYNNGWGRGAKNGNGTNSRYLLGTISEGNAAEHQAFNEPNIQDHPKNVHNGSYPPPPGMNPQQPRGGYQPNHQQRYRNDGKQNRSRNRGINQRNFTYNFSNHMPAAHPHPHHDMSYYNHGPDPNMMYSMYPPPHHPARFSPFLPQGYDGAGYMWQQECPPYAAPNSGYGPFPIENLTDEAAQPQPPPTPHTSYSFQHPQPSPGPVNNQVQQVPPSPYWGHLGQMTMAVTGLASPDTLSISEESSCGCDPAQGAGTGLFVNPSAPPYYGYPHRGAGGGTQGYTPPSPATQFQMSMTPQQGMGMPYLQPRTFFPTDNDSSVEPQTQAPPAIVTPQVTRKSSSVEETVEDDDGNAASNVNAEASN